MAQQEVLTQKVTQDSTCKQQTVNYTTQTDLIREIELNGLDIKFVLECEAILNFMQKNSHVEKQFCFKEEKFEAKRLTIDANIISVLNYLQNLTLIEDSDSGTIRNSGVKRFHDQIDTCFSGDYDLIRQKFTEPIERIQAYKQIHIMKIINGIPNGNYFYSFLRCCYIERAGCIVKKINIKKQQKKQKIYSYNIVFVYESGRNTLGRLLQMNRNYSEFELITILRQLLEGGATLEKYSISQNNYQPYTIALNKNCDQVKIIDFTNAFINKKTALTIDAKFNLDNNANEISYKAPQLLAFFLKYNQQQISEKTKHCLKYFSQEYNQYKSDVYSVAMTICTMKSIAEKEMMWCFSNRSKKQKRALLENNFQCSLLQYILYNMLLNDEDQRWDFRQALQETERAIFSLNQIGINDKKVSYEVADSTSTFTSINSSVANQNSNQNKNDDVKTNVQKSQELQIQELQTQQPVISPKNNQNDSTSSKDQQYYNQFYSDAIRFFKAGTYEIAVELLNDCLDANESEIDKAICLFFKGECLMNLKLFEEAQVIFLEELALMKLMQRNKCHFIDENNIHLVICKCQLQLGVINYRLGKLDEALRYCEQAILRLKSNNPTNDRYFDEDYQDKQNEINILKQVLTTQAAIYQRQRNFQMGGEMLMKVYEFEKRNNKFNGQADYFTNMAHLKLDEGIIDQETLSFVDNAINLYQQSQNNSIDLVNVFFDKCLVQCGMILQNKKGTILEKTKESQSSLQMALDLAMNLFGGKVNKQYAEYIQMRGRMCNILSNSVKSAQLQKHAIHLTSIAMQAYKTVGDNKTADNIKILISKYEEYLNSII